MNTFKVVTVAQEIIDDMGLTDVTVTEVASWIRNNVGRINNLINQTYVVDDDLEYSPAIGHDEKDIIKCAYATRYLKNLARNSMTSAANQIIRLSDDVSSVSFTNANEVAKVYRETAKAEEEKLKEMSKAYRYNKSLPQSYVAPSLCNTAAPNHYYEDDLY